MFQISRKRERVIDTYLYIHPNVYLFVVFSFVRHYYTMDSNDSNLYYKVICFKVLNASGRLMMVQREEYDVDEDNNPVSVFLIIVNP